MLVRGHVLERITFLGIQRFPTLDVCTIIVTVGIVPSPCASKGMYIQRTLMKTDTFMTLSHGKLRYYGIPYVPRLPDGSDVQQQHTVAECSSMK